MSPHNFIFPLTSPMNEFWLGCPPDGKLDRSDRYEYVASTCLRSLFLFQEMRHLT